MSQVKRKKLARHLGERILRSIANWDLSQRELARRIGVHERMIGRYCLGESTPTPYILWRLSLELCVSIDTWFDGYHGEECDTEAVTR